MKIIELIVIADSRSFVDGRSHLILIQNIGIVIT